MRRAPTHFHRQQGGYKFVSSVSASLSEKMEELLRSQTVRATCRSAALVGRRKTSAVCANDVFFTTETIIHSFNCQPSSDLRTYSRLPTFRSPCSPRASRGRRRKRMRISLSPGIFHLSGGGGGGDAGGGGGGRGGSGGKTRGRSARNRRSSRR